MSVARKPERQGSVFSKRGAFDGVARLLDLGGTYPRRVVKRDHGPESLRRYTLTVGGYLWSGTRKFEHQHRQASP